MQTIEERFKAYLEEEVDINHLVGKPQRMSRHKHLSFIIYANGGLETRSYGVLSWYGGHQRGIEEHEYQYLVVYRAFFDGIYFATDGEFDPYGYFIENYFNDYAMNWDKVEQANDPRR